MDRFEYEISTHAAAEFSHIVYECGGSGGQCEAREKADQQITALAAMLNDRGQEGWELVQILMGPDSLVAFWKRKVV